MIWKLTARILVMGGLLAPTAFVAAQQSSSISTVPSQLTLQTATDMLIRQSPILLRNQLNSVVARSNLRQAGLRPNPDLEITSESYPVFESNPGSFWNNQELVVRAGQTIETGGKRSKRIGVARQELAATESDVQNTFRELKLELKQRYYVVVLAKAQRELAEEILKQFDDIIRVNEARFKTGELSGLEINRIRAERARFSNDLLDADLQLKNSKTALVELLGVQDLNIAFDVAETLAAPTLQLDLASLQREALQSRPDLVAEKQRLERNRQNLRLQQSEAVPNVTPSFGYKRDFGVNTAALGVSVPLPLFNRNQGGVSRASAEIQQQQYETSRVELAVRREVQQAYQTAQTQVEKVKALEGQYVPSARKAREIAQQSYRLGALDLIELLDSERTYRETVRAYNLALFDFNASLFQLEAAVGKEF